MIDINIGEKTYSIPEYMTVKQYQDLQVKKIFEDKIDSKRLLSIYLDIPEKELSGAYMDQVKFIEEFIYSRITKNINKEVILTFDLSGTTYGFENNWKKLTWGFWTDLEFLSSDDITQNIHNLLAVFYRPVKSMKGKDYVLEPYNSDDIYERGELLKQAPINLWFGASNVFFFISARYTNNIKDTLMWGNKIQKWILTGMKILPKSVQKKLLPDFTSERLWNSPKTTSQK